MHAVILGCGLGKQLKSNLSEYLSHLIGVTDLKELSPT